MDNITWKDIYVQPFHNDEHCEVYVKDFKNQVTFNKCENNPELYDRILSKLNGFTDEKINVTKRGNYIYLDGRRILLIRGWGRLTGIGMSGFQLGSRAAASIQDDFGDWVIETLNK